MELNSIKPYDYVYCTNCRYFRLDDEEKPYCPYEDECDIWDSEDGRRLAERPHYEAWTCTECANYIGGGDFNLCCRKQYWLCYTYTPACEKFEKKENLGND